MTNNTTAQWPRMPGWPERGSRLLTFAFATAICSIFGFDVNGGDAAERPNILLIVTDDQGYWDTGYVGNPRIDTPAMDRLASEGVVLNRFYAAPVCSPTRAGLMTGRYAFRTGLYNTRFGGDTLGRGEITVADLLLSAGYRTALFGKWHLGRYADYQPRFRGFEQFFGHHAGHIEHYSFPGPLLHNGQDMHVRGYITDVLTDAAVNFVTAEEDRPFFCYLALNAPHSPFLLDTSHFGQPDGDKLLQKYLDRDLPLRDARIYAMIERIDTNLARLLAALEEHDLTRNTAVFFMSDNGGVSGSFQAGLRGKKSSVYEGGVRVPFIARQPGAFPASVQLETQATHVDLLPTFCELAGVPVPDDRPIDGRSLVPLLTSGTEQPHQPFVYHTWDRYFPNPDLRWSVSDGRYKLLCQVARASDPPEKSWKLFDLQEDPEESRNIAPQHADRVTQLRAEFLRWFSDVTEGRTYAPVPIPLGHPSEPVVEMQASWATVDEPLVYEFDGYDWDYIRGWQTPADRAVWKVDVLTPGRYAVRISYAARDTARGRRFVLENEEVAGVLSLEPTPTQFACHVRPAGTITLERGLQTLWCRSLEDLSGDDLHINRIFLEGPLVKNSNEK